jgi:hypothetical protein
MTTPQSDFGIDEYFRKRLTPVEGAIPQLNGIDVHGSSIPAGLAGDLFEYINFEQRCNIDARIAHALRLTTEYLEPLSDHQLPRNLVDAHVEWMRSEARFTETDEAQYRMAKTSEQQRIAEDMHLSTQPRGCSWLTPRVTTLSRQRLPQLTHIRSVIDRRCRWKANRQRRPPPADAIS